MLMYIDTDDILYPKECVREFSNDSGYYYRIIKSNNTAIPVEVSFDRPTERELEYAKQDFEKFIPIGSEESKRGEGIRYNTEKTPYECIPIHLIAGAARVFKHVTKRKDKPYPLWNWVKGMPWSVPYACMIRHLDAWYRGETNDPETEENHLHHVLCNLLMLIHYEDAFAEGDDRPSEFFKKGGMDETN